MFNSGRSFPESNEQFNARYFDLVGQIVEEPK
jgi:hypothetical protein